MADLRKRNVSWGHAAGLAAWSALGLAGGVMGLAGGVMGLAGGVVAQACDLSVASVSTAGVQGDWQTLQVFGIASAVVANEGAGAAPAFAVAFFEDGNGNGTYEAGIDTLLGSVRVPGLAAGAQLGVSAAVSGTVRFRGNLVHVMADSEAVVAEANEANNSAHSGAACGTADLTASVLLIPPCTPQTQSLIQARLGNGGSAASGRVPMTFYENDPALGGRRIGTVWTTRGLVPGAFEDVVLPLPLGFPYLGTIVAVADDQGGLSGTVLECNEANNVHSVPTCRASADWSVYGQGFPGTSGIPQISLDARPIIGTTVHLQIENSSSRMAFAMVYFGSRPAALPSVFGGTLLLQPEMEIGLRFLPQGTSYPIPIPCDVRMCGSRYYFQALQVDLGARYGVSFTPGLEMMVGRR